MNSDKILVYGERACELIEAHEFLTARQTSAPPDGEPPCLAALCRAICRAEAEALLELADSAWASLVFADQADLHVFAYLRVRSEVEAVRAEPLVLRSHPRLAHDIVRRHEITDGEASV